MTSPAVPVGPRASGAWVETEWKRPLDEINAEAPPLDIDDETLKAEVADLRRPLD